MWILRQFRLTPITAKPVIYAFNVDEEGLNNSDLQSQLTELVSPSKTVFVCAKLEEELKGLSENDAKELLESYGVKETGLAKLIHAAYDTLGLQSYLTAGEKRSQSLDNSQGAGLHRKPRALFTRILSADLLPHRL